MAYRPKFSDKQKEKVYLYFNGKCSDCGKVGTGGWWERENIDGFEKHFYLGNLEIHHLIPLHVGGKHIFDNWILFCPKCHDKRHKHLYIKLSIGSK
jgi:5-methylcytosine-specific restriction endonuclease McrA